LANRGKNGVWIEKVGAPISRVNMSSLLESEIVLPGPFVVLQGMQGDGMCNTIDSVPIVQELEEDDLHHVTDGAMSDGSVVEYEFLAESSSGEQQQQQHHSALPTIHQSPLTTLDPMLASTNMPPLALNPLTATTSTTTTTLASFRRIKNRTDSDSFIVVDEQQQQPTSKNRAEERAIEAWRIDCRAREERQREEWLVQRQQHTIAPIPQHCDWWQQGGKLVIMNKLPTFDSNGRVQTSVKSVLSSGSTVVGIELIYLDWETLRVIPYSKPDHSVGVDRQIQMLKLDVPHEGFVVFSVNGYCFLGPGMPCQYMQPDNWMWKVTYSSGAFVRDGLELNSNHITTLPYGSFVQVTRKTISTDGGLSRLWIHATLKHDEGATPIQGWISEYLNPTSTSGERGPIVQPVPFPVPALYRVSLKEGATIRSDIELSSKQIGHAPFGSILKIVGRAFSEHPEDKCIERLKLAGNGGWVSARLNELPPDDTVVFSFQNVDCSFDPDHPAAFHLAAHAGVHDDVNPDFEGADLSSIDESTGDSVSSVIRCGVATDGPLRHGYSEGNCIACLSEERNATIVHGETGHIACCLICARILKAQGKDVSCCFCFAK
jgi:E3 ubiquitin-protein ligase Mdm2